jgi:beta-glucosidase/6-phospho-beta-glucosidase/beta-galactosidase
MLGRLPEFLCPKECVGALDFVGLDYYWGVPSIARIAKLLNAAAEKYGSAPVWPGGLSAMLRKHAKMFPGKPIVVVENGCVQSAGGTSRETYLREHLREVQRAVQDGIPVTAYLCWSITSNREWGLPFNGDSDFGIYHIDLDGDPALTRKPTPSSAVYGEIIAKRSAE